MRQLFLLFVWGGGKQEWFSVGSPGRPSNIAFGAAANVPRMFRMFARFAGCAGFEGCDTYEIRGRLETLAKPARLVRLAGLWASPRCDRASRQTPEVRDKALPEPNSVREKTMILWGLRGVATF